MEHPSGYMSGRWLDIWYKAQKKSQFLFWHHRSVVEDMSIESDNLQKYEV
jgi:hypothetical protein